ncbi:MAG TPA: cytochrome c maturation protein CcmE [Thermoanaerobaculia bacterium]|jgi:cytochrome c-type biogenesis protein CcmE|nr:cytochrome c maturation protein CcmE [Thermoanaerobaculia bacterium]
MKKNRLYLFGLLLLVAFAAFSFTAFKDSMTPYVSYEKAREGGRIVQVAGALEKGSYTYVSDRESLLFTLQDPKSKQTLRVRYKGLKPANFEDAISIVAIGNYDDRAKEFEANKLLVKCPSKYQGAEVEKTYS